MKEKPKILAREIVAQSRLFKIERLHLKFSNGAHRHFERLLGSVQGAVLIIPMLNEKTILLVREYCAGTDRYEISFPKGLLNKNEDVLCAANRELMEEVGYKANHLEIISEMTAAPGYWGTSAAVIYATDLVAKKLEGDEPEPLEVIEWPLKDYKKLLERDDFTEARSIASLLLIKEKLL